VNPDYADLWFCLTRDREAIAHYNPEAAVRTMMGQVRNQIMRWNKFDNNKTLYHLLRITHALRTYLDGERFEDTLAPKGEDHEFIMAVRQGKFGQEEMQKIFDRISQEAMSYHGAGGNVKSQDFVAECIMEHCLDRFMQRALAWRFTN
jgi:hypothetical protein